MFYNLWISFVLSTMGAGVQAKLNGTFLFSDKSISKFLTEDCDKELSCLLLKCPPTKKQQDTKMNLIFF